MSADLASAVVIGFVAGYAARQLLTEWLARRRPRCETCGSRTTDDGIGACAALDSEGIHE